MTCLLKQWSIPFPVRLGKFTRAVMSAPSDLRCLRECEDEVCDIMSRVSHFCFGVIRASCSIACELMKMVERLFLHVICLRNSSIAVDSIRSFTNLTTDLCLAPCKGLGDFPQLPWETPFHLKVRIWTCEFIALMSCSRQARTPLVALRNPGETRVTKIDRSPLECTTHPRRVEIEVGASAALAASLVPTQPSGKLAQLPTTMSSIGINTEP